VAPDFPTNEVRGPRKARSALPNKIALMRATSPMYEGSIGILTRTRRARSKQRDAIETTSNGGWQPD